MMDYNEDNSDHDDTHTSKLKDKVEQEEEEEDYSQGESVDESQVKNNGSSNNTDPLTEAFNSFHTLQEALKNELERFQELGKETTSSSLESSSCIHAGHERTSASSSSSRFGSEKMGLTSLDSEILNLVNNVEHLETKLDEAKCVLEVKESQIRELESTISVSDGGTEIGMEEIFKQKMEAEVEYIIYSRSVANLSRKIKLIEEEKTLTENQAHKMLSKLEKAETKAENLKNQAQDLQKHCVEITEVQEVKSLKNRVFKKSWCLLLQLGLMYMIMFNSQSESEFVVPT